MTFNMTVPTGAGKDYMSGIGDKVDELVEDVTGDHKRRS